MGQAEDVSITFADGGVVSASNFVQIVGEATGDTALPLNTTTTYWSGWYGCYHIDKTRQAFQIIQILVDRKMIKLTSVKKFIELVDEIYKVL